MKNPKKILLAPLLALALLGGSPAYSSSVFDGTNADLWLIDASEGRVSGYDLGQWLEQYDPGTGPVFPLNVGQQALINNLMSSSLPMTPNQPAISIAGIDAGLDGGNPDGHPKLLVLPESGSYGETIRVEMRVDTAIMELDRPTLNWTVDGGAQQSILLSKELLQQKSAPVSGGYYTIIVNIARNGAHTIGVTLTEPGSPGTLASASRNYTLVSTHPDSEGRDTDGDGIPDVIEAEIGLDPFSDDWLTDADGDGWSEFDAWLRSECLDPVTQLVLPASACLDADGRPVDTDSDGWSDFDEILRGTNHLDPEPTLPVQQAVASKSTTNVEQSAVTQLQSTNFCTDGSTFYLDLDFHADANDAQLFDIIVGIGSTAQAFTGTESNQRVRVNFDEAGNISRGVDPKVQEFIVDGIVPPDRWQVGLIQDFTIESTGLGEWHLFGSFPVGSEPYVPGDLVRQLGIRSGESGNRYLDNIPVSGNLTDCGIGLPPPPPPPVNNEPTGLDFKDYPAARRLYEVEKIVSGTFASSAVEPLPVQNIEAATVFGQKTYSSKDLLSSEEIIAVSLRSADVASRLQASVAAAAIAAGQIPVMRLPVSESGVVLVEHRLATSADYSRIYKLWVSQLPDVSPRSMFEQPGQPVYASAAEWRGAFVAYLAGTLAIDVSPVQVDIDSTRIVSLVEGVLSDESRLSNGQKTQLFTTEFGSVDEEFITATVDALRRYGGPDYTLDDVASQLSALTQAGQALAPVGGWIDAQFMTVSSGARSDAFIVSRLQQSYDSECFIESSVVAELQADATAWAEFIARCPNYVTEVELPGILIADQARRHQLRLGFIPGSPAPISADATLLEPGVDSDVDNRINTIEVNRPLPETSLPWDPDTDGDLILDGDDLCIADPYNECSRNPILPGISIGANIFVSEPEDGSGVVLITIILDRVSDEPVTVDYRVYVNTGDTATDGSDFTAISGSVTIAAGERVAIIAVPIFADNDIEGAETFTVEITGVTGAVMSDDGTIVVTLNDPGPGTNSNPVFTSGTSSTVLEGSTDTAYVAAALDADNDVLSFSISAGADQAEFSIDAATGVLRFVSVSDFNAPTDVGGDNSYDVQITVDDGNSGTDTLDLIVSVVEAGLTVEVTYPTPNANLGGGVTLTTVTGNIVDPAGNPIDPADINFITVNANLATIDAGNPSRWSVQVPVTEGLNRLDIGLALSDGTNTGYSQDLHNFVVHNFLDEIALVSAENRALVIDTVLRALLSVDLTTGVRESLSGLGVGLGTDFSSLNDVVVDVANGRALVIDGALDALFAVDLTSGDRTILSRDPSVGVGVALDRGQSVALDSANNRALVATTTTENLLISVDLATGDRSIISGGVTGTGVDFVNIKDIVVDVANNRVLVLDSSLDAVIAVDLATGDRSIVSDAVTGTGTTITIPEGIALDSAGNRVLVVDQVRGLLSVDLSSGDRTVINVPHDDYGPNGSRPYGVAWDSSNNRILLSDQTVDAIFAVDSSTGERTILSDSSTGSSESLSVLFGVQGIAFDSSNNRVLVTDSYKKLLWGIDGTSAYRSSLSGDTLGIGPALDFPGKVVVDTTNNEAYFVEMNRGALTKADLANGDRAEVSSEGSVGSGPGFSGPHDVALDISNNRAFVTDWTVDALFSVDLTSGNRTIVSDATTGTGPVLTVLASVAYDSDNNRVLIMDWDTDQLIAVDLVSGNRTVLSDNVGTGTGTGFNIPFDMALDTANNRVLIVDYGTNTLFAVDLISGDRTDISGGAVGSGVSFLNPYYIALDSANDRAFIYDLAVTAIIVVELSTGERAVMSK